MRKGESVLLEPTFEFRIEVPETASGRVMADITKMGGTCEPAEAGGGRFAVTGNVPASEIGGYDVELASFTSGDGNMALREGPYTLCNNSEEVIEKAAYDPDRDISNTGDSVFCSHGAGVNVPWNESDEKMHMRFSLDEIFGKAGGGEDEEISFNYTFREREKQYDPAELERIFSMNQPANRNLKKDRKPAGYKGRKIIKSDSGYRGKSTGINNASSEEILIVDGYNAIFAWNELKELAAEKDFDRMDKSLPVLFVSGEEDPVGGYGKGVRRCFRQFQDMGFSNVSMKLYPGDRHEILNELDRAVVYDDIEAWIRENVKSR